MTIPRNADASIYNAWFRKQYPELFECEIAEVVENCDACGFCDTKTEKEKGGAKHDICRTG